MNFKKIFYVLCLFVSQTLAVSYKNAKVVELFIENEAQLVDLKKLELMDGVRNSARFGYIQLLFILMKFFLKKERNWIEKNQGETTWFEIFLFLIFTTFSYFFPQYFLLTFEKEKIKAGKFKKLVKMWKIKKKKFHRIVFPLD